MDNGTQNPDGYNHDNAFDNCPPVSARAINGATSALSTAEHVSGFSDAVLAAQTQHVIDLNADGDTSKLAWGKSGMVARVVEDGSSVELSGQRFDVISQAWTVFKPVKLEADFNDVVGVSWNIPGMELAVFERTGGVHIFTMLNTALNRFIHSQYMLVDPADELHKPIGTLWLNLSKKDEKTKTILENVKEEGRWRHEHVEGLRHPPHMLKALAVVDRTGMFSLLYTRDASTYKVLSVQIAPSARSDLYTHGAMAQTAEGSLLLALHQSTGQLSAYMVSIQGNDIPELAVEQIDSHVPNGPPYFSPELEIDKISQLSPLLTHLRFFAELEYNWEHLLNKPHLGVKQPATLLAVYACPEINSSSGRISSFGSSVAKRWHFQKANFELHPKFGNGQVNGDRTRRTLQPLKDILFPAAISGLQLIDPGNTLAVTSVEGSVGFYNPQTLLPTVADPDNQVVSNIGQVKLAYPRVPDVITRSLSSHALADASLDLRNNLSINSPSIPKVQSNDKQTRELNPDDPTDDALIASYILGFSRSCWNAATYDDILSSIHNTITPSSMCHIRRQLFTTLFQPKIFVPGPAGISELDKVPHLMIVFKALAFHFGLFRLDETSPKHEKYAYLWAWTVLNLRWCIMVVGDTYKTMHVQKSQQPGATLPPPTDQSSSFLEFVNHNIRWLFGLYAFIFSSLLNVSDRLTNPDFFFPASASNLLGDEAGNGSQGFVALLLTCNWSRATLLIGARLLNACATKAHMSINFGNGSNKIGGIPGHLAGTTLGRVASTIQACCTRYGITTRALEIFLDQRFHPDQWKFNKDGSNDDAANRAILDRQVEMIVTGKVHVEYQGVVRKIIDECINGPDGLRARGEIDRLRLSEEVPDKNELLLNIDDIAFQHHQVAISVEEHPPHFGEANEDGVDLRNAPTMRRTARKAPSKRKLPTRLLYDVHKKLPLFSHHSLAMNKNEAADRTMGDPYPVSTITSNEILRTTLARRCVRCGSLSDSMLEGSNKRWPRYVVILMNKCVCDGSWIVEEVGNSLQNL